MKLEEARKFIDRLRSHVYEIEEEGKDIMLTLDNRITELEAELAIEQGRVVYKNSRR